MNELALFAGAGGGILGGKLLGWRTICAIEIDPYASSVLLARQQDGCLEPFPIWDDVTTFDGYPWAGRVDVVSGGFPCQDISTAGKGKGIYGERSGLWSEFARIIGQVQPRYVLVENSPMLTLRGLDVVLGDLATLGYDTQWGVIGASAVGAPHLRERIWIVAYPEKGDSPRGSGNPNSRGARYRQDLPGEWNNARSLFGEDYLDFVLPRTAKRASQSGICLVANGLADGVGQLETLGNGQVPAVVRLAWSLLSGEG